MNHKLQEIYEQVPKVLCPKGCGKCCGPVFPSLTELRNIKDWCEVHHIIFKPFLDISKKGDCPYLDQSKRCSIYPVRPFICRLVGASVDIPCPLRMSTARRMLNSRQSDALYSAIYLKGKEKPRTEKHRRIVREVFKAAGYERNEILTNV